MYRLYWATSTSAFAVEAVLAEAGIHYERIALDRAKAEQHDARYLAVNPLGQIPALILPDGTLMTESAACALYLAEAHPACGLLPPPVTVARAVVLRWLSFGQAQLYECHLREFYSERYTDDAAGVEPLRANERRRFDRLLDLVEAALKPGPFLLGAKLSLADIYIAMIAGWHSDLPTLFERCPRIEAMVSAVCRNPALAPLWVEHYGHKPVFAHWTDTDPEQRGT